jgi:hypothetical protein
MDCGLRTLEIRRCKTGLGNTHEFAGASHGEVARDVPARVR